MRYRPMFAAAFLSASLLASSAAQAMEIQQYDKMSNDDESEYVARLVGGAEQVFKDEGRPDLAAQVDHLFITTLPGDKITIGVGEFQLNLARARVADAERIVKDPNAHRLHVEDAMLVTLKKNNIPLSENFIGGFRAVNNNFRPKTSPMVAPARPPRTAPPAASQPKPSDDDPIGSGGFITPPKK